MEWHDSTCTKLDLAQFQDGQSCLRCGSFGPPLDPVRAPIRQLSEIRILTLLPGAYHDPISCQVTTASLSSHPEYEAISYTWALESGDATASETITLGARRFNVTKNCHSVLRRARRQYSPRQIWIDAICIDQENIQERGHQVGLMPRIYSGARNVLIYVGETWRENGKGSIPLHSLVDGTLSNSLGRFLQGRRYFSRLWTLQEVALARRATLICGDESMTWDLFRLSVSKQSLPIDLPPAFHFHYDITSKPEKLIDLLALARKCEATDARDKVFALLGLLPSGRVGDVEADYSLSVEEVYIRVALHLVNLFGWGPVLSNVGRGGNKDTTLSLPSWVPDWSVKLVKYVPPDDRDCDTLDPGDNSAFSHWNYDDESKTVHAKLLCMTGYYPQWVVWEQPLARICHEYFVFQRHSPVENDSAVAKFVRERHAEFVRNHGSSLLCGQGGMPFGSFTARYLDVEFENVENAATCRLYELRDATTAPFNLECYSIHAMLELFSAQTWKGVLAWFRAIDRSLEYHADCHVQEERIGPPAPDPFDFSSSYMSKITVQHWAEISEAALDRLPVVDDDVENLWITMFSAGKLPRHLLDKSTCEEFRTKPLTWSRRVELCSSFWKILVRSSSMREVVLRIE